MTVLFQVTDIDFDLFIHQANVSYLNLDSNDSQR